MGRVTDILCHETLIAKTILCLDICYFPISALVNTYSIPLA